MELTNSIYESETMESLQSELQVVLHPRRLVGGTELSEHGSDWITKYISPTPGYKQRNKQIPTTNASQK